MVFLRALNCRYLWKEIKKAYRIKKRSTRLGCFFFLLLTVVAYESMCFGLSGVIIVTGFWLFVPAVGLKWFILTGSLFVGGYLLALFTCWSLQKFIHKSQ